VVEGDGVGDSAFAQSKSLTGILSRRNKRKERALLEVSCHYLPAAMPEVTMPIARDLLFENQIPTKARLGM
jgi:hypothetical protein